ncbi:DMT family transporter [uncultured Brachyspira sp.]|uniref:DMT family transporter n=1 Tax=uncultured Brachyspira sp. TaxID=221953 RepID=UPI00263062DE|nr:DMT family transporter [uncultured Brachyspira sp.]
MNNIKIASLYIIFSALAFSIMQMIVKISGENIPIMEQVFARNFVTLIISTLVIIKNKEKLFPNKNNIFALFCRAFFGYLGVVSYFYATNNMLLADASILQRTSPFWSSFFAFIIIKEKISKIQCIALLIAIFGSILVIKPSMNSDILPALVALASAIFAGIAYAVIGFLKGKESNALIIFYFSLFSTVFSLFFIGSFIAPNFYQVIMLLLIGIFAGLGQFFLTIAYKKAPVSRISIYNYMGVIFSYLLSVFILNEIIDIYSIIGMFLTITAALMVYFYKNKSEDIKYN